MLSIIVAWCNRDEIGQAMPSMLQEVAKIGGEVVVVNFGGNRDRLLAQLEHDPCLRVIEVPGPGYFNRSRANNVGAHHAAGDVLFFCDCDILIGDGVVASLYDNIISRPGHFATLAGVRETKVNSRKAGHITRFGYELNLETRDGRSLKIVDHEEDANDGTRQAPGLLMVRRRDFVAVSGYNGRLLGWGWEDQDIIVRLTLGAGLARINEGIAMHISHDDETRVANYPDNGEDRWASRDRKFRQALAFYDAGDFSGTLEEDATLAAYEINVAPSNGT